MSEPRQIEPSEPDRVERWLAPVVFGVPWLYLLTSHSYSPWIGNYSVRMLAAIAVYGLGYALVLWSYRRRLPLPLEQARGLVVLGGASLLVAAVSAETVLSLLDGRPLVVEDKLRGYTPDPDLGYVYTPDHEQLVVKYDATTPWRANAQGVRAERDYGTKPEGVHRVLAIGDSFTVGARLRYAETWPALLEASLDREIGPTGAFEVVNAGHSGYGTMHQAAWLEKYGDRFEADSLILAMTPNDVLDNAHPPPGYFTAVDGYLVSRHQDERLRNIRLHERRWYSLPGLVARSHVAARLRTLGSAPDRPPHAEAHAVEPGDEGARLHAITEAQLLRIRDWAAERGMPFALVLLVFKEQLAEMPPGYAPSAFGERWSRFARRSGIPVVDLYPQVATHPDPASLYWRWDGHFAQAGARMTANAAFALAQGYLREAAAIGRYGARADP